MAGTDAGCVDLLPKIAKGWEERTNSVNVCDHHCEVQVKWSTPAETLNIARKETIPKFLAC